MTPSTVEDARGAFSRGDWVAAFEGWSSGADAGSLAPADLEDLATAAELLGHHDHAVRSLQAAFTGHLASDQRERAVWCAFRLAMTTVSHGEPALFAGWVARAESLAVEGDGAGSGWVAFLRMFRALQAGRHDDAATSAAAAVAVGLREGNADLIAMGLCAQGRMALYRGQVAEGLALLDQAMVRVISGEAMPLIAGHVYCTAIEGCQEISDFGRVAEWTSALERWCAQQPGLLTFTGQCAVHRGQLLRIRGNWPGALEEFSLAEARYRRVSAPDAIGQAAYEAGDVHRLRGEWELADSRYSEAAAHGYDPEPGLVLLWVACGRVSAALHALDRLLAESPGPVQRLRLLPAAVEVLVVAGEVSRAREAAAELAEIAPVFGSVWVEACAVHAAGAVEVAGGDPLGALPYLRRALGLWRRAEAPFEAARVQVLMGRALSALGDDDSARREFEAARTVLRRLGARPLADEVSALLAPGPLPGGLTAREVEVLRLVASGLSNAGIAADLVLSEKTVARHISNIFTKLDVGSRTAAAAYAYTTGLA